MCFDFQLLNLGSNNNRSTSSLCCVSSAIISSNCTTNSVKFNSSACFFRFSYRSTVSDSAFNTASSNPFTSVGCGTSADLVVRSEERRVGKGCRSWRSAAQNSDNEEDTQILRV